MNNLDFVACDLNLLCSLSGRAAKWANKKPMNTVKSVKDTRTRAEMLEYKSYGHHTIMSYLHQIRRQYSSYFKISQNSSQKSISNIKMHRT